MTEPIYFMRDNHTFKKLSEDVDTALIEIEHEFNEGWTYGSLCSKREGFPMIHASGSKKRLEFFAECKKTLEEWLPHSSPPHRQWVGLTEDERTAIRAGVQTYLDITQYEYGKAVQQATELKLQEKNT